MDFLLTLIVCFAIVLPLVVICNRLRDLNRRVQSLQDTANRALVQSDDGTWTRNEFHFDGQSPEEISRKMAQVLECM